MHQLTRWRAAATRVSRPSSSYSRSHSSVSAPSTRSHAALVDALRCFHAQHQHFVVPSTFRVPASDDHEDWPPHTRGLSLGRALRSFLRTTQHVKRTNATQQQATLAQLHALGFPVVAAVDWSRFQWEHVALSALCAFQRSHGHLRVPRNFVVPENDATWPRAAWGYRLGAHVNQLRARAAHLPVYQREALDRIGFTWHTGQDNWARRFLPALERFRELHGHVNVPQKFVVPSDDDTGPEACEWQQRELHHLAGFPLGRMVNRVRTGDAHSTGQLERFRPALHALGFAFSSVEATWDGKILPSLTVFRAVYGHCKVGAYFQVPHTAPWPPEAYGCKLGFIVRNIRLRGDFFQLVGRDMERLDELGFVWNPLEARWRQRVLPSLETFVREHGHAQIDRGFVVPARAPWPERTHGLDLGRIASDPSVRRKYADFIAIERGRLEALGFFWSAEAGEGGGADPRNSDSDDSDDGEESDE